MNSVINNSPVNDPAVPDWSVIQLPDTRADQFQLWNPISLVRLIAQILGKRRHIELPDGVPGVKDYPKYIFQEFHNVPNGNYSKRLTHGYITGFDRLMLRDLHNARQFIVQVMNDCRSVLDVGTAGGRTAAAIKAQGIQDVWGIDPSPYLLQHAAQRYPDIHFVQGIAEHTPFVQNRFDGIAVCFVMHEIPPKYIEKALQEFSRILKSGGKLVIVEPAAAQLNESIFTLYRKHGWRGMYYKLLAGAVHEPFVRAWHAMDFHSALRGAGFTLRQDEERFPVRCIVAEKP